MYLAKLVTCPQVSSTTVGCFKASQIPQAVFKKKRLQAPLRPFTSGYRLEDYVIGNQIGKGSNAAVYEAAASLAPLAPLKDEACVVELKEDGEQPVRPLTCCSLRNFPLAIKMMWNFGVGVFLFPPIAVVVDGSDD